MSNETIEVAMDSDGGEAPVRQAASAPTAGWTKGKLIFLGLSGLIFVGVIVALFSGNSSDTPNQSKISSPAVPLDETVTGIGANPEYNAVVDERNKVGAKLAEEKGLSFVPKLTDVNSCEEDAAMKAQLEKERLAREEAERQAAALRAQLDAQKSQQNNGDSFILPYHKDETSGQEFETKQHFDERQKVVTEQMNRLRDNILSPATPMGTMTLAAYKPDSINGKPCGTSGGTPCDGVGKVSSATTIKGMYAGEIVYATLETAINSDVKSPVLAIVRGGALDGARLIGSFSQQRDYVVLEFSRGSLKGKSLSISSIALDPSTTLGALADDVDHHYLLKIGAVAGAAFLQGYGQAIQLAGQQIEYVTVPGSLQTVPVQTNELTDKQIAAIALGQVGETLSAEIKKAADRPTTVYVDRGAEIGLLLLDDVKIN